MTLTYRIAPKVAVAYARARGLPQPTATDELLRILADARPQADDGGPLRLRYRNRSDRLDVSARIVNGCCIAVSVRGYHPRKG